MSAADIERIEIAPMDAQGRIDMPSYTVVIEHRRHKLRAFVGTEDATPRAVTSCDIQFVPSRPNRDTAHHEPARRLCGVCYA
jgi:hypothetical protein